MISRFNNWKSSLFNSEYRKSVSYLIGGSGISQLILICVAPIITRLYTPESIGAYELFTSVVAIFLSITTMQYDVTVYTASNRLQAIRSLVTTFLVISSVTIVTSLLLHWSKPILKDKVGISNVDYLEFLIPAYIFFSSGYNSLINWFTKFGNFKFIAKTRIFLSLLIVICQVSFGLMNLGYWGLVLSTLLVQVLTFIILFIPFIVKNFRLIKFVRILDVVQIIKKNYQLPLYVLPGDLLNNITQNLPSFFIGKISESLLGYYSLSKKILGLPLNILSSAFRNIYINEASKEFTSSGKSIITVKKHLKIFIILGLLLIISTSIFTPLLMTTIFGKAWENAVPYIIILSFSYVFRFVSGTLSFIMILGDKSRKIDLFWQISMMALISSSFFISEYFKLSEFNTILIYSLATCIFYILYVKQVLVIAQRV